MELIPHNTYDFGNFQVQEYRKIISDNAFGYQYRIESELLKKSFGVSDYFDNEFNDCEYNKYTFHKVDTNKTYCIKLSYDITLRLLFHNKTFHIIKCYEYTDKHSRGYDIEAIFTNITITPVLIDLLLYNNCILESGNVCINFYLSSYEDHTNCRCYDDFNRFIERDHKGRGPYPSRHKNKYCECETDHKSYNVIKVDVTAQSLLRKTLHSHIHLDMINNIEEVANGMIDRVNSLSLINLSIVDLFNNKTNIEDELVNYVIHNIIPSNISTNRLIKSANSA